ncbi:MAG: SIS domain-containing protein, partial [Salinibacterium sp.]|nr:SIS domain-containing protein [Salinibacterium sp.]
VAATKTYTAQLMAIAMLSAGMASDEERLDALAGVGPAVAQTLADNPLELVGPVAERYRYMEQCVVLGRGYNYATAHEWSLKLKELTYVVAEPYSSADFKHGPIAIVERGFPVLAVIPSGRVSADLLDLAQRLETEKGAELLVISDEDAAWRPGRRHFRIPTLPEWMSPLVAIVPAQLFTLALTLVKNLDPEHPRGLHKVTETT